MQFVMAASNITFFKDWAFVLTSRAKEGQVWFPYQTSFCSCTKGSMTLRTTFHYLNNLSADSVGKKDLKIIKNNLCHTY